MSKMRKEIIGNAELYFGDCREVLAQLEDSSVDMIFTDPPYGHNNNNNGNLIHRRELALGRKPKQKPPPRPIANDGDDGGKLIRYFFKQARRLLVPGGCCCCCCGGGGGGGPGPHFARWSLWLDRELDFKQMIVWDKGPIGMGWHYRRSYEVILVGTKPGAACKWYDESNAVENIIRPGAYGIKKIIPLDTDHPTPKTENLSRHFIGLHSKVGDIILDPFMGGGSTGVSAIKTNRRFIGIECEQRWFDMACNRVDAAERQASLFNY